MTQLRRIARLISNNNIRLLKIDKPQLNTEMLKLKLYIHSTNIKLKEKHHQ